MAETIETRCSSIPMNHLTISPKSIVIGTKEPTIRPARRRRKAITTSSTVTSVW